MFIPVNPLLMTSTHRWYLPSMTTEGVKPFHDVRPHRWVSPYYDVISQIGVSPFTKRWRQDTTLQGYHPPLRPSLSKATPFLGQPSPRLPNRWSIRLLMSSAHREYPPLMASTHRGGGHLLPYHPAPSLPTWPTWLVAHDVTIFRTFIGGHVWIY